MDSNEDDEAPQNEPGTSSNTQPPIPVLLLGNTGVQGATAQQNGTKDAFTDSREQSEVEAAFGMPLDPTAGSPAAGKSVAGIINLFVNDLFGTGGKGMEQRVLSRLGKDFHVGSEDWY